MARAFSEGVPEERLLERLIENEGDLDSLAASLFPTAWRY